MLGSIVDLVIEMLKGEGIENGEKERKLKKGTDYFTQTLFVSLVIFCTENSDKKKKILVCFARKENFSLENFLISSCLSHGKMKIFHNKFFLAFFLLDKYFMENISFVWIT